MRFSGISKSASKIFFDVTSIDNWTFKMYYETTVLLGGFPMKNKTKLRYNKNNSKDILFWFLFHSEIHLLAIFCSAMLSVEHFFGTPITCDAGIVS